MEDINGKLLHIGDRIRTNAFGTCIIRDVIPEEDGDLSLHRGHNVLVEDKKGEQFRMRLRACGARRVPTIKELAQMALVCQGWISLPEVLNQFTLALNELRLILEEEEGLIFSLNNVNQHPISVLFASKIASLSANNSLRVAQSYEWTIMQTGK